MSEVIQFLTEQGPTIAYIILFLGSLVEGESVVLTAGYLAFTGFLKFKYVLVLAFFASTMADQSLFFVGRFYGSSLTRKFPSLKPRFERAFELLHKYNTSFIFLFRFIYGIRTISPIIIGASRISIQRFAILNLLAGVIWALLSCGAGYAIGYYFSDEIEWAFERIVRSQKYLLVGILAFIAIVYYLYKHRQHTAENKKT